MAGSVWSSLISWNEPSRLKSSEQSERNPRLSLSRSLSFAPHVPRIQQLAAEPICSAVGMDSPRLSTSAPTARSPSVSALRILAIAVLGKHGNPLFLQSYWARRGGQADLKWQYAAHTALDFFEERGESQSGC